MDSPADDLINTDYRFGIPLSYKRGDAPRGDRAARSRMPAA